MWWCEMLKTQIEKNDIPTPKVWVEFNNNWKIQSITINGKKFWENDFEIYQSKCLNGPSELYTKSEPQYSLNIYWTLIEHWKTNKKFDVSNQINMKQLEKALESKVLEELNTARKLDSIFQKIDQVDVKTNFFRKAEYKEDFLFLYNHFSEMSPDNKLELLGIMLDYIKEEWIDFNFDDVLRYWIKTKKWEDWKEYFVISDRDNDFYITYHENKNNNEK